MAGSSKYWEKRALEREARWTDKCQKEIEQEMARYYAASIREIEKDILVLYGRFAMDNGLSMRDARTLLHGQEFRDWRMGMKEYLAEIKRLQDAGQISESRGLLRELNTLAMRSRITVLDKLRSETLRELDSLGRKTETAMGRFLGDAYKDAYYRSVFDIGKEGMFRGSFSKVDSKQVENVLRTPWSGKNYSERIWKDMQKLESTIQDVVTQGIHRGLSAQKMTQKVMERMNVSQSNAERLVRTEMNYAQNQAALEGIKDAGLMYYCFVAVMDRRTTPICREHDGEVFPVEEARAGSNVPPLHPRCRSTIIASLDEEGTGAKGGRRVSRGSKGQNISIPAEMKYSDWKAVYVDKSKTWTEWKVETGYKGREMFANSVSFSSQAKANDGIMRMKDSAGLVVDVIHKEMAVVADNGLRNNYTVNYEFVNSKAYHDKFEKLTRHKPVDEALYKQSAKMLAHRTGSEYEDIAMLDARTGELLVENTSASGEDKFKAGLTKEQASYLDSLKRQFEILHNHPGSTPPSMADIEGLFIRPLAVASTISGHDGSLYRMIKRKQHDNIKEFLDAVYESVRSRYPDWPKKMIEIHAADTAVELLDEYEYLNYVKR